MEKHQKFWTSKNDHVKAAVYSSYQAMHDLQVRKKKIWSNILLVDKYFHKLRIKETIEFCLMEIEKTNSKIEPNIFGINMFSPTKILIL